jgi:arginine utilization protein RocB
MEYDYERYRQQKAKQESERVITIDELAAQVAARALRLVEQRLDQKTLRDKALDLAIIHHTGTEADIDEVLETAQKILTFFNPPPLPEIDSGKTTGPTREPPNQNPSYRGQWHGEDRGSSEFSWSGL